MNDAVSSDHIADPEASVRKHRGEALELGQTVHRRAGGLSQLMKLLYGAPASVGSWMCPRNRIASVGSSTMETR